MKNAILLIFILLTSFNSIAALNRRNEWHVINKNDDGTYENRYALIYPDSPFAPQWKYITAIYTASPLTAEQRFDVLGIPNSWSEQKIKDYVLKYKKQSGHIQRGSDGHDVIDRMFFRAMHFVLGLTWSASDKPKWKNLTEKRYSYLRDLLTELSELPGVKWSARDLVLQDGTHVFQGHEQELLIIDPKSAEFYRSHNDRAWKDKSSFKWQLEAVELRKIDRSRLYCSYLLKP